MGFKKFLIDTFTYSGDAGTSNDSEPKHNRFINNNIKNTIKSSLSKLSEDTITNTMNKIEDIKSKISKDLKITDNTKDLVYRYFYLRVLEDYPSSDKEFEEYKLLFKKFLEEEVVDDSAYSNQDLKYINKVVSVISNELKIDISEYNVSKDDIITYFNSSKYILEIAEILTVYYKTNILDYACDNSYIVLHYTFNDNPTVKVIKDAFNNSCFSISFNGITFYLAKEVSRLIDDEDTVEKKKDYIINKLRPYFEKYIILKDLNVRFLYPIYCIFKYLEENNTSIYTSNSITNNISKLKEEASNTSNTFINKAIEEKEHMSTIYQEKTIEDNIEDTKFSEELLGSMKDRINYSNEITIDINKDYSFDITKNYSPANPNIDIDKLREEMKIFETLMKYRDLYEDEEDTYNSLKIISEFFANR